MTPQHHRRHCQTLPHLAADEQENSWENHVPSRLCTISRRAVGRGHSSCNAVMGSSVAALRAGYTPKKTPILIARPHASRADPMDTPTSMEGKRWLTVTAPPAPAHTLMSAPMTLSASASRTPAALVGEYPGEAPRWPHLVRSHGFARGRRPTEWSQCRLRQAQGYYREHLQDPREGY
jgi:hypothetical protein